MSKHIEIYDTTLRDGAQGEGVNFSVEDKCRIAVQLDELGIDFIEGGWPGSNPRDMAFFERARLFELQDAQIAAFGATFCKSLPRHPSSTLFPYTTLQIFTGVAYVL